jgi:group I intron endonuclease
MEYTIYKLTSPNGKIYIGQTNNFNQRMIEHKNCKKKNKLYNCVRKYGWDSFKKEIITVVDSKENANLLEESLILKYKSTGHNGLNTIIKAEGGDVWVGRYDTEEYLEFVDKMKELTKGNKNGMFGKSHSAEAIQKQKDKAKGRFSLEWFIDRNGKEEGLRLWEERREFLRNRNLPKGDGGKFISNITH